MTTEPGTFTPTDEDVERVGQALDAPTDDSGWERWTDQLHRVLASIGPILERERRAAKVEALAALRSGCGCIVRGIVNADTSGCYCDCSEYGYSGCEHEIERDA